MPTAEGVDEGFEVGLQGEHGGVGVGVRGGGGRGVGVQRLGTPRGKVYVGDGYQEGDEEGEEAQGRVED